eukprot:scaffold24260_cov19-Tisochrysis_lutea.AAC.2
MDMMRVDLSFLELEARIFLFFLLKNLHSDALTARGWDREWQEVFRSSCRVRKTRMEGKPCMMCSLHSSTSLVQSTCRSAAGNGKSFSGRGVTRDGKNKCRHYVLPAQLDIPCAAHPLGRGRHWQQIFRDTQMLQMMCSLTQLVKCFVDTQASAPV